jgi:type I restriction enzyme S subunit
VSVASERLENVAQVVRGVSFDKAEVSVEPIAGMVPILRAGNISDVLDTGSDLIWVPSARVKQEQLLRSGDIAICMSSGSQSVVGKSAPLCREWTGSVGAFCAIVRPRPDRVEPAYLALYMRSEGFRTWTRKSEGANIKNIRHSELLQHSVPVPPLGEQRRIVDLLSRAEGIVRMRREAEAKAKQIIPALFLDMFSSGVLRDIEATIEDVVEQFIDYRGKTPSKSKEGVPLITARVVKGGRILPPTEFISDDSYDSWMRRGLPQRGDVLFTMEAPLGESALVVDEHIALAQRILLMRPRVGRILGEYLMTALKMPSVWKQIEERSTGSTVRGIRQSELRKVVLPVPPISLQEKFSERVQVIWS